VFLCRPEAIQDAALLARYESLLDAAERARLARFRFPRDARAFLIAHALVRDVLSRFCEILPGEWRFKTNGNGRPEIAGPAATAGLRFSLSHCRGLIACLVAENVEPGVDVEEIRQADDLLELAERFFSPSELVSLRHCSGERMAERFFALWTLKESYIKARGMGVSLPLDKFSFRLCRNQIGVRFDPEIRDRATDWAFSLLRAPADHFVAVALGCREGQPQRRLCFHQCVPLKPLESAHIRIFASSSGCPKGSQVETTIARSRESGRLVREIEDPSDL
jgi:4'-phosphopantetheinyl transferase